MSCVSESYTRRVFPHVFRVFLSVSPLILLLQSYNCAYWINSVLAALVFRFVFFDFECFGADYRNGFMSKMHYQKRNRRMQNSKILEEILDSDYISLRENLLQNLQISSKHFHGFSL